MKLARLLFFFSHGWSLVTLGRLAFGSKPEVLDIMFLAYVCIYSWLYVMGLISNE
jgi:hypothetical protein